MMQNATVTAENLSKAYRIGLKDEIPDTAVGAVASWIKSPWRNFQRLRRLNTFENEVARSQPTIGSKTHADGGQLSAPRNGQSSINRDDTFWALKDVSFSLQEGDAVGIIGRNGAGKSTLLKILSRITEPTSGQAIIRGRVSSLLEVGTGFHPELTGRENVYMNGTILGMTKREIDRKFDEIVDFSGVEKFLDTPVKRYSSGMQVRLAFAVAAHLEPEILIIDEVLAVGDAAFQRKCLGKIGEVARQGRTIIFVSHNIGAVTRLCSRAILLNDGRIIDQGTSQVITRRYFGSLFPDTTKSEFRIEERPDLPFQILSAEVTNADGDLLSRTGLWDIVQIRVSYLVKKMLRGSNLAVCVARNGDTILESFDVDLSPDLFVERAPGYYRAVIPMPTGLLPVGTYTVSLFTGLTSVAAIDTHRDILSFEITANDEDITHKSYSRGAMVMAKLPWNIKTLSLNSHDQGSNGD